MYFTWNLSGNRDDSTLLIKTDSDFVPIWRKSFATHLNDKKVLSYSDGSLLFFSRSGCFNMDLPGGPTVWHCPKFIFFKLDSYGESVWSKKIVLPGADFNNITPFDAFQIDANTLKVGGTQTIYLYQTSTTDEKPLIMNFDNDGNFIQGKILEGLYGHISSMTKIEGSAEYYALVRNRIIKFNADDTILWIKRILLDDLIVPENDNFSTQILANGDIMVGGRFLTYQYTIFRISPDGNLIWSKKFDTNNGTFGGITELSSGDLIVTHVTGYSNQNRSYATKMDASGNQVWSKSLRPATSISPAYEKNANELYFAIRGYSSNDVSNVQPAVIKTDASGNSLCDGQDADIILSDANATLVDLTTTITYTAMPILQTTPEPASPLIELDQQTSTTECLLLDTPNFVKQELQIFPNPNNGSYTIKSEATLLKIEIFNMLGQKIYEVNPNRYEWSCAQQNKGIYLARIENANGIKVMKVIVTE